MTATRQDVDRWIEEGKEKGATHIISVCDTFDWDDYPVYVMSDEDVEEKQKKYDGSNMQIINEIINLTE